MSVRKLGHKDFGAQAEAHKQKPFKELHLLVLTDEIFELVAGDTECS